MKKIIETDRLILKEFDQTDAQGFFNMNNDSIVMQYTGDDPFKDLASAEQFIHNYDHYQKYGHGRWTVLEKKQLTYLGWCGLRYSPEKEEVDIGFRFQRTYWNKGFATESAKACLKYGMEKLGMEKIVGRAMKDNLASIRVLEKLGMKFSKAYLAEEMLWVQYEIINSKKGNF